MKSWVTLDGHDMKFQNREISVINANGLKQENWNKTFHGRRIMNFNLSGTSICKYTHDPTNIMKQFICLQENFKQRRAAKTAAFSYFLPLL